jgi:hypothetical protein
MLFRSTGLGKRELVAEIVAVKRQGDYLIMEVQTTEPVRWKIRGGVTWKDLRMLIKAVLNRSFGTCSPSNGFRSRTPATSSGNPIHPVARDR